MNINPNHQATANMVENTILRPEDMLSRDVSEIRDHEQPSDVEIESCKLMQMIEHENTSSDLSKIKNIGDDSHETGVNEKGEFTEEFILPTIEYGNNVDSDYQNIESKTELDSEEHKSNLSPPMSAIGDCNSMEYLEIDNNIFQGINRQNNTTESSMQCLTSSPLPTDHNAVKVVSGNIEKVDFAQREISKNIDCLDNGQSLNVKDFESNLSKDLETRDTLNNHCEGDIYNITVTDIDDEACPKLNQEFATPENVIDSEFVELPKSTLEYNSSDNNSLDKNFENELEIEAGNTDTICPDSDPLMSNIACHFNENISKEEMQSGENDFFLNETPTIIVDSSEDECSELLSCLENKLSQLTNETNVTVTANVETEDIFSKKCPKIAHSEQQVDGKKNSSEILDGFENELSHNVELLENEPNLTVTATVETKDISKSCERKCKDHSKKQAMIVEEEKEDSEILDSLESVLSHNMENETNLTLKATVDNKYISTSNELSIVSHLKDCDINIIQSGEISAEIKIPQHGRIQNKASTKFCKETVDKQLDDVTKKTDLLAYIQAKKIKNLDNYNSEPNPSISSFNLKVNVPGKITNVSVSDPLVSGNNNKIISSVACEIKLSNHLPNLTDENLNQNEPILIIDEPGDPKIIYKDFENLKSTHENNFSNKYRKQNKLKNRKMSKVLFSKSSETPTVSNSKNNTHHKPSLNNILYPKLPKILLNNIDSLVKKMELCKKVKVIINRIEDEYGKVYENKTYKLYNNDIIVEDDDDDDVEIVETPIECIEINDDDDESSTKRSTPVFQESSDDFSDTEYFDGFFDNSDNVTLIDESSNDIDSKFYLDEITGVYTCDGKEVHIVNDDIVKTSGKCMGNPGMNLHQNKQEMNNSIVFNNNKPTLSTFTSINNTIAEYGKRKETDNKSEVSNNKGISQYYIKESVSDPSAKNIVVDNNNVEKAYVTNSVQEKSVCHPILNETSSNNEDVSPYSANIIKPNMEMTSHDSITKDTENLLQVTNVENVSVDYCKGNSKLICKSNYFTVSVDDCKLLEANNVENVASNQSPNKTISKESTCDENGIEISLLCSGDKSPTYCDVDIIETVDVDGEDDEDDVNSSISEIEFDEIENDLNIQIPKMSEIRPTVIRSNVLKYKNANIVTIKETSPCQRKRRNYKKNVAPNVKKKRIDGVTRVSPIITNVPFEDQLKTAKEVTRDKRVDAASQYICKICGLCMEDNVHLIVHETSHVSGSLNSHLTPPCTSSAKPRSDKTLPVPESHTSNPIVLANSKPNRNPKKFHCLLGSCGKSFVSDHYLRKHTLTHSSRTECYTSPRVLYREGFEFPRVEILPLHPIDSPSLDILESSSIPTKKPNESIDKSHPASVVMQKKPRRKITVGNCSIRKLPTTNTPILEIEVPIEVGRPSTTKTLREQRTSNKMGSNGKSFLKCRPFPDLVNAENVPFNAAVLVNNTVTALPSRDQPVPDLLNIPWHTPGAMPQGSKPNENQSIPITNVIRKIPHYLPETAPNSNQPSHERLNIGGSVMGYTSNYEQINPYHGRPQVANYVNFPQQILHNGRPEILNPASFNHHPHQVVNNSQTERINSANLDVISPQINNIPMNIFVVTPSNQNDSYGFNNINNLIRTPFSSTATQMQGLVPPRNLVNPEIRTVEVPLDTTNAHIHRRILEVGPSETIENQIAPFRTNVRIPGSYKNITKSLINTPASDVPINTTELQKNTAVPSSSTNIEDDIDNLLPVSIIYTDKDKVQNLESKDKSIVSYCCDFCESTFMSKAALSKHHSTPLRECSVCECSFCDEKALVRHMDMHSDKLPQKCNYCNKRYEELSHLIHHIHWAHSNCNYTCGVCSRVYRSGKPPINNVVKIMNNTQTVIATVCEKCDINKFDASSIGAVRCKSKQV